MEEQELSWGIIFEWIDGVRRRDIVTWEHRQHADLRASELREFLSKVQVVPREALIGLEMVNTETHAVIAKNLEPPVSAATVDLSALFTNNGVSSDDDEVDFVEDDEEEDED